MMRHIHIVRDEMSTPITSGIDPPMLRLLSSKAQVVKAFLNTSKPCHVDIHWIALTEYCQMSTHMPGFWSFNIFFA